MFANRTKSRNKSTKKSSQSFAISFCNHRNPWFLLLTFALIYCIGFILFLPSGVQHEEDLDSILPIDKPIDDNINHEHHINNKDNNMNDITDKKEIKIFKNTNIIEPVIVDSDVDAIESWRFVENNKSFPMNNNTALAGKFIELKHEWGTKYLTRVLCLIPTLWPDRKEKMDIIASTWGKGCTKLMWVIDEDQNAPNSYSGFDTLIIPLIRKQNNEKHVRNIWEKVHRMWTKIYSTPSLYNNFEWFIKADDDTFIATENLFGFLQYYDASFPHYLGHSIRSRWRSENVVFNSGICYVLSRETIRRIGYYQQHLPTTATNVGRSHCIDRDGAGEDPTTGICLLGVGIRPGNTMDHNLRERFLIFRDTDHQKIFREDTWFWKYKPMSVGQGLNCCSPYLISMHNYKSVKDAKHFFPLLIKQYNQKKNWDNIILPPKPRYFIYDKQQIDFEIDEFLNINNPPKGQRIYKGIGKEWQCNKCNIGKNNDPYWTEWWDGSKYNQQSQHVNDAYSPIKKKTL